VAEEEEAEVAVGVNSLSDVPFRHRDFVTFMIYVRCLNKTFYYIKTLKKKVKRNKDP
jgi:hypothetical protein